MSHRAVRKAVLICARLYLLAAHPVLTVNFVRKLKAWPDPASPRGYHEKILWRKIVDRNPAFVELSDKLAAKRIARARCPALAIAKVLWIGSDPMALPASLVSGDVAIKTNHGYGTNILVTKGEPELAEIVARTRRWMAKSYDRHGQWAYRDIPRRIFAEEKVQLGGDGIPTDVKVHLFAGLIGHVWAVDKLGGRSRTYDAAGEPLDIRDLEYPGRDQALPHGPEVAALVRQAIDIAPRLLGPLDYARVDFMIAGGRLYFGEFTVYPGAGYDVWLDRALTERAGRLWDLHASAFLRRPHRGVARIYAEALRAAVDEPR